jgi:hypothetical protein
VLSENLRIIAKLLLQQWSENKDEIHALENGNMTIAYGYAAGVLLGAADELEADGR